MAATKNSTSQFHRDLAGSQALVQAAKYLFLANPNGIDPMPAIESADAQDMLHDAKYRAAGAHRRGIPSCRLVVVERIAAALAVAEGYPWPSCGGQQALTTPDTQYEAICANRRQRFRHLARLVVAEVSTYYELGSDTEAQRLIIIEQSRAQCEADKERVSRLGNGKMASTVSQLARQS